MIDLPMECKPFVSFLIPLHRQVDDAMWADQLLLRGAIELAKEWNGWTVRMWTVKGPYWDSYRVDYWWWP